MFECLGDKDPTGEMYSKVLDLWREGEEAGFVSRNVWSVFVSQADQAHSARFNLVHPTLMVYSRFTSVRKRILNRDLIYPSDWLMIAVNLLQ